MSLINDALKQARKAPPMPTPASATPAYLAPVLPPAKKNWLPVVLGLGLLIPAILFVVLRPHSKPSVAASPNSATVPVPSEPSAPLPAPVASVSSAPLPAAAVSSETPAVSQIQAAPAPPPEELPVASVPPPVLQGVFYSPNDPSAIVDGKSVRPGDTFKTYRVQEISQSTVTLLDARGHRIKIGLGK